MISLDHPRNSDKEKTLGPLLVIFAAFLASLILRFTRLSHFSLWYDEIYTLLISEAPFPRYLAFTNHPPLYFTIMHFWVSLFGTSEFALRVPSVIAGSIGSAFLVGVGFSMRLSKPSLWLLFFLSVLSPYLLLFSQEARMYPFLFLAVSGGLFFLIRAVNNMGEKKNWVGFVVLTILSLYFHFYGLVFFFSGIVYILFRKKIKEAFFPILTIVLFSLPIFIYLLFFRGIQSEFYWLKSQLIFRAVLTGIRLTTGYSLPLFPTPIDPSSASSIVIQNLPWLLAISIFFGVPFLLGLSHRRHSAVILSFFLIPYVLVVLVSVWIPILSGRYVIGLLPGLILAFSVGIERLKRPLALIFSLGMLLLILVSLKNYFFNPGFGRPNWRGLAAKVQSLGQGKDPVLISPGYNSVVLEHYLGDDWPIFPLPSTLSLGEDFSKDSVLKIVRNTDSFWFESTFHRPYQKEISFYKALLDSLFLRDTAFTFLTGGKLELIHYRRRPETK